MIDPLDPRQILRGLATRSLTKLLTLQDRNPHSPTYGCFDRNFWHLRITDFPSGMAQEFVLPLALAYAEEFAGNPFYHNETVREWIRAGLSFAAQSAHTDGSCDDYYPFEKAAGAAAFSLYAALHAIHLAELDFEEFSSFLELRGSWLANHQESGRLSNHEALIANNLFRLETITGKKHFAKSARRRLKRLLSWQNIEGWFYEYQGCDPGYLTLTIANLAEIDQLHPELGLRDPIRAAVQFLLELQPPDGWLSGEWTSRNTNNYFPHGFEICGKWLPEALVINSRAMAALAHAPEYDDDHILAHHCWSYLFAAQNWIDDRPDIEAYLSKEEYVHFSEAGFVKQRQGRLCLLTSLNKGGSFRLYDGSKLIQSDTGVSILLQSGNKKINYVCHLWSDDNKVTLSNNQITITGNMERAKASQMTPIKNIILRILMLSIGRMNPDFVRRMLQRLLITGKSRSPFTFNRELHLFPAELKVIDHIEGKGAIVSAGIGPAQTSTYTVMSRVFHHSQLQPWENIPIQLQVHDKTEFTHTRCFKAAS